MIPWPQRSREEPVRHFIVHDHVDSIRYSDPSQTADTKNSSHLSPDVYAAEGLLQVTPGGSNVSRSDPEGLDEYVLDIRL